MTSFRRLGIMQSVEPGLEGFQIFKIVEKALARAIVVLRGPESRKMSITLDF